MFRFFRALCVWLFFAHFNVSLATGLLHEMNKISSLDLFLLKKSYLLYFSLVISALVIALLLSTNVLHQGSSVSFFSCIKEVVCRFFLASRKPAVYSGPSSGFSSRGATFKKYSIGYKWQPGAKREMGGRVPLPPPRWRRPWVYYCCLVAEPWFFYYFLKAARKCSCL